MLECCPVANERLGDGVLVGPRYEFVAWHQVGTRHRCLKWVMGTGVRKSFGGCSVPKQRWRWRAALNNHLYNLLSGHTRVSTVNVEFNLGDLTELLSRGEPLGEPHLGSIWRTCRRRLDPQHMAGRRHSSEGSNDVLVLLTARSALAAHVIALARYKTCEGTRFPSCFFARLRSRPQF
jgi:hypothetical protein